MFPKSKRFQGAAPQAPPVGAYDVKCQKHGTAPGFGKGKRFADLKDTAPGPATNNKSFLDTSSCSTSSRNDSKCSNSQFATPLPSRKSRKISSSTPYKEDHSAALENEVSRLLSERTELKNRLCMAQQQVQDLENHNNNFSEWVAQLRTENIELREKLKETEEKLEDIHTKMVNTLNESQSKIYALEELLSKEILKSKELGDKLESTLKQSGENFSEAQSRIVQLQEAHDSFESKNRDMEAKLLELIEREQSAEEQTRCLSAEKLSLESRLEKCESDYEQRLAIANDQVESLQQELKRCEEMMTENLRSLTGKYQDLEELYTCFQSEAEKEKQLILAELEVTKDSLQKSRQESEQQQNTCVFLNRQSEELQNECDKLNRQLDSFKVEAGSMKDKLSQRQQEVEAAKVEAGSMKDKLSQCQQEVEAAKVEADSMTDKLSQCQQEVEAAKAEVKATREELAKHLEETEFTKASLRNSLDEAHKTINDLHEREEILSQELQRTLSDQKKQDDELETLKDQLDRAKCETPEAESMLKREVDRYQSDVNALEEKLAETEENFTGEIKAFKEKAAKLKEEFGRRLVETQKKLSQIEISFEKFKNEQEVKMNEKDKQMERKIFAAEEEVSRLKSELSSKGNNEDQLNEYTAQIEMWKTKYEQLWQKIEPFKDQLDEYEAERNALLCQNSQAKDEVAKLGQQYAKLLGHQNKKQKIHHVIRLKEENNALKNEITKLRDQAEKQKRAMKKLEEKTDQVSAKKRFNPDEAFSHAEKEKRPLSVISYGNGSVHKS